MANRFLCWTVAHLVPGHFTLGFEGLGEWYDKNEYYIFKPGDNIEGVARNIFGYGMHPKGTILSSGVEKGKSGLDEGFYNVDMEFFVGPENAHHTDFYPTWLHYVKTGELPEGARKMQAVQRHFKWNIENQFKRVKRDESACLAYSGQDRS